MTQRNKSACQHIAIVRDLEDPQISLWDFLEFDIRVFCFRLAGDARAETVFRASRPIRMPFNEMTNDDLATTIAPLFEPIPRRKMQVILDFSRVFRGHECELYLVGGPVRDLLLQREIANDFDFATDALPALTQELGREAGATSVFAIGERFGTIGFAFPGSDTSGDAGFVFEITTYRSEEYPDETRKPVVQHGVTLLEIFRAATSPSTRSPPIPSAAR